MARPRPKRETWSDKKVHLQKQTSTFLMIRAFSNVLDHATAYHEPRVEHPRSRLRPMLTFSDTFSGHIGLRQKEPEVGCVPYGNRGRV